jgi:hypothetical protein
MPPAPAAYSPAPILTGQRNDRLRQRVLIRPSDPFVALCPFPLSQQPVGMPLRDPIVLAGMPDRATPPLRA